MERKKKMEKRNGKALLPIFVFVVLYLGLGILFEYGLRIEMGFYKIPVVVINIQFSTAAGTFTSSHIIFPPEDNNFNSYKYELFFL